MTATAESTWAANKERALFVASTVLLLAGGAAWLLSAWTRLRPRCGSPERSWVWSFSVGWTVAAIRAAS